MSWLTSLFSFPEPADLKLQRRPKRILEEPIPTQPPPQSIQDQPRHRKNKAILGAGLAFFAFSLLITRRALTRKRFLKPAFYTNAPNHREQITKQVSAPIEAVEALNIATINVLSLAMIGVGGSLWYLDIDGLEEGRRFVRGGMGVDGTGRSEQDAEEEFEEWLATVLSRKEEKEKRGEK
jgi:hypothetical protein